MDILVTGSLQLSLALAYSILKQGTKSLRFIIYVEGDYQNVPTKAVFAVNKTKNSSKVNAQNNFIKRVRKRVKVEPKPVHYSETDFGDNLVVVRSKEELSELLIERQPDIVFFTCSYMFLTGKYGEARKQFIQATCTNNPVWVHFTQVPDPEALKTKKKRLTSLDYVATPLFSIGKLESMQDAMEISLWYDEKHPFYLQRVLDTKSMLDLGQKPKQMKNLARLLPRDTIRLFEQPSCLSLFTFGKNKMDTLLLNIATDFRKCFWLLPIYLAIEYEAYAKAKGLSFDEEEDRIAEAEYVEKLFVESMLELQELEPFFVSYFLPGLKEVSSFKELAKMRMKPSGLEAFRAEQHIDNIRWELRRFINRGKRCKIDMSSTAKLCEHCDQNLLCACRQIF